MVSPSLCASTAGKIALSARLGSLRTTRVVPSAPARSSKTPALLGISRATTSNCTYEMKSKYSGSSSLPCSMTSGAYWNVYGSHSACRDFQNFTWNWSMGKMSMASTVSYPDRSSSTASRRLSFVRGNRTGSGGSGSENPALLGKYALGALARARSADARDAARTSRSTASTAFCAAGDNGGGASGSTGGGSDGSCDDSGDTGCATSDTAVGSGDSGDSGASARGARRARRPPSDAKAFSPRRTPAPRCRVPRR